MHKFIAIAALTGAYAQTTNSPFYSVDCEEYGTPELCRGNFHEGKLCYWHCGNEPKCQEAEIDSDEWHCAQQTTEAACPAHFCVWSSELGTCFYPDDGVTGCGPQTTGPAGVEYGEYEAPEYEAPETEEAEGESIESPESVKTDCEIYDSTNCVGNFHEGKACYYDALKGTCEEGEPGDREHICAAKSMDEAGCTALGCYYEYNGKCSDEMPGLLRKSQPASEDVAVDYRLAILYFFLGLGGTLIGFYSTTWCLTKKEPAETYVTMDSFSNHA